MKLQVGDVIVLRGVPESLELAEEGCWSGETEDAARS